MEDNKIETKIEQTQPVQQEQKAAPVEAEDSPQQIDWRKFKEARKKDR